MAFLGVRFGVRGWESSNGDGVRCRVWRWRTGGWEGFGGHDGIMDG